MRSGHIIQKQFIEVISSGESDGFALQRETERLYKQNLLPGLERLLDNYVPQDRVVSIDRLYVEIDDLTASDFESGFSAKILMKLEALLKDVLGPVTAATGGTVLSLAEKLEALLVHYLEKGYLPWWGKIRQAEEWRNAMTLLTGAQNTGNKWKALKTALVTERVRLRFPKILPDMHFWQIMQQLYNSDQTMLPAMKADLEFIQDYHFDQELRINTEHAYKELVISFVTGTVPLIEVCEQILVLMSDAAIFTKISGALLLEGLQNQVLKQMLPVNRQRGTEKNVENLQGGESMLNDELIQLQGEGQRAADNEETADEEMLAGETVTLHYNEKYPVLNAVEIYVANAGLVILAAYLPMFFSNRQLLEGDKLRQKAKAVALLHYLIYHKENYEEFESVLSKILCGIAPEAIVLSTPLRPEDRQEADALLEAVIAHWQVLKNTSPAGLRDSFLQREGKLVFINGEWQLTVHKASHDVLMAHLPWNINMIKLPWMPHLLKVDWT